MVNESAVSVVIDDRIRLISAVLSATNFPAKAQDRKRHHAHAHARATMKYLTDHGFTGHPAVQGMQNLLDQGAPLEALYTLAMHCSWPDMQIDVLPRWAPPNFNRLLKQFYEDTKLADYWQNASAAWDSARIQSVNVFANAQFKAFLKPFLGEISENLMFMPNICYPADHEVGISANGQLIAITPPPQAWGDSPPWPYDDESMLTHSYRAALGQYARQLLVTYLRNNAEKVAEATRKELPVNDQFKAKHATWEEQFIALFIAAAVAMYLEDYVSESEARAYMMLEKKAHGMTILPGTISVLRRYLQEHGNKFESLADFLLVFPAQLRVAKKIVTM